MEQHNDFTPQEQPIESVIPNIPSAENSSQAQPAANDIIVTSYGVVTRNDVENLIKLNNELGQVQKKSVGKRVIAWFFGIIGGVTFLLVCVLLCFAAFKLTAAEKPNASVPDSSDSPEFSYDEDFFQIPNVFGNDEITSDSDQTSSKTSDAGLGIIVSELDSATAGMYDISGGLVILGLLEPTSFSGTDVREYDIITAAEGSPITTTTQLSMLLNKHQIGDEFTLTITRFVDGFAETFDVTVILIDKNARQ